MKKNIALSGVALFTLMLAVAPAHAQVVSIGGGGNDSGNSGVSVDIGGSGGGSGNGLLGLGDDNDDISADVDLDGGTVIDVDGDGIGDLLDIDGDGVGDREIEVDLFGAGDGNQTQVAVGDGGGNDDVLVTLFGSGAGADTASVDILPGGTGGGNGGNADADVTVDLFGNGDDADPTQTGSTDGTNGGGGSGGNDMPAALNGTVAANGSAGSGCFTPNDEQIAHLLARGSYNASVTSRWKSASDVDLVAVNLCPQAEARIDAAIDADANADYMQRAVAGTPAIVAELSPSYTAENVLAVDQSGAQLTVYVY